MPLTARLVAGASLVITVDTMVAHLAGALGRPVWLLLKHDPDWRWPTASERTPWYPTMRIYRQTAPGAWGAIMARVVADLAALR
nr:glycosyltransferase family 9 protein [Paracoccus sp. S-4012]